jgi:hypothetical protein
MAWMRCPAAVTASVQGQGSAASVADESGGGGQDAVAHRLRLRCCEVAVQRQETNEVRSLSAEEAPSQSNAQAESRRARARVADAVGADCHVRPHEMPPRCAVCGGARIPRSPDARQSTGARQPASRRCHARKRGGSLPGAVASGEETCPSQYAGALRQRTYEPRTKPSARTRRLPKARRAQLRPQEVGLPGQGPVRKIAVVGDLTLDCDTWSSPDGTGQRLMMPGTHSHDGLRILALRAAQTPAHRAEEPAGSQVSSAAPG